MAPLPPLAKTIQFQLIFTDGADSDIRNMLYFTYTNTLSNTDLQTICATVKSQWSTHMATSITTNVQLEEVFASDLSGPTSAQSSDGQAAVAGSNAGTHLTSGAAFVMSNETARKYRGGHSRNYIAGLPANDLADANTWTAGAQAALLTAWSAFLNGIVSVAVPVAVGVLQHVVAHRFGKVATVDASSGLTVVRSVPLTSPFTDPVVAIRTNPQVGSQRRRNLQAV
jgi:hypothetical protein